MPEFEGALVEVRCGQHRVHQVVDHFGRRVLQAAVGGEPEIDIIAVA